MKEIKIIKALNQNFTSVSYVNTLDDIIYTYKSKIISKFPWIEELLVEIIMGHNISGGGFNPNENSKTLGILISFNAIPNVPEFDIIIKNTFESGINEVYPR